MSKAKLSRLVVISYLAILILQPMWHGLMGAPPSRMGWLLAAILSIPLLLPLRGILMGQFRSMTWGGFLLVGYFVIGVMEAWTSPGQRAPALTQVALALLYVGSLVLLARRQ